MSLTQNDILWILVCACLVFVMQVGFLFLETGLTQGKNNINVAIKNLADFGLSTVMFWLLGFGIMFGTTQSGFIGVSDFAPQYVGSEAPARLSFLLFQIMFCGTAVTIISGAIAERVRFGAYLVIAVLISGLVYPVFGHWVWNGLLDGTQSGWLGQLGYYDFAGSTVVHSVGGWAGLAALMIIGPRNGRFGPNGESRQFDGAHIPLAAGGMLVLYLGWFGFNGGSSLSFNSSIATILTNTLLAGSSGMMAGMLVSRMRGINVTPSSVINGCLAGLVAITAGANAVTPTAAALIGAVGGAIALAVDVVLVRQQIDDAVGAVPVHLGGAIWGALAVGIFGDPAVLGTGLSLQQQIGAQLVGIAVNGLWAFGATWLILTIVQSFYPLRVSERDEAIGLNVAEHGTSSELSRFVNLLDRQSRTGNLSLRAQVNHYSEIGRISEGYNRLLDSLEQTTQRSNTIVDQSRDGIIMFGQDDLRIRVINPAAQALFRVSAENSMQHPITNFLTLTDVDSPVSLFRHINATGRPYPFLGQRTDNSSFPLELSIAATVVDDEPVYISSIRDVTEQTMQHEQLEQLNQELTESNRYKDAFLASMSHELRTPLNAILGMSEALESSVYGDLNDAQLRATSHIQNSGKHLLDLIDEILDLSKISAGGQKLDKHTVSVKEVCDASIALVAPQADAKAIELVVRMDETIDGIHADPKRLKQILVNLLNNAVKFTEPTGRVGLMVVAAPSKQVAHFVVWDTGIGMEESVIPSLFQPFVQGENGATRRYGGTGLGLAIVQRLVDLHDGSIKVSSEPDKGSRFVVTLPWDPELKVGKPKQNGHVPHETAAPVSSSDVTVISNREAFGIDSADYRPPTILLAEDNEANIATLSDYLIMQGYRLEIARNGLEAIEHINKEKPDIVLMDVQMPKMDGLTAIKTLRETYSRDDLPIIALTAFAMPTDRDKSIDAGANEYLSKPIRLKQLVQTIQVLMNRNNPVSVTD